tara:strand:+ start:1696 stop:1983 length:288 start_codon:yes stop_codon:yes gene_type:complete
MQALAMFLGMSLGFGGVGGLLSGVFARSFRRAMIWAIGFGLLDVIFLYLVSPTSRFAPGLVLIGVVWGLVGWSAVGRLLARRRAGKEAATIAGAI